MPNGVCRRCERAVYEAYTHKQMCEQSDETLRQYLQQMQSTAGFEIVDDVAICIQLEAWMTDQPPADMRSASTEPSQTDDLSSSENAAAASALAAASESGPEPQLQPTQTYFAHRKPRMAKQFECEICQMVYKSKKGIRDHMKQHTADTSADRSLACSKCDMKFTRLPRLLFHMQRKHPQAGAGTSTGFQCAFCPKTFAQSEGRSRHMRQHLATEPLYTCDVCKRTFQRKDHLM